MTVRVNKPAINVREKLAELDKPTGIAGEAMLRADTVPDQAELLGYRQQNVIINGDMQIAQRGTSITGVSNEDYMLDRWRMAEVGNAAFTATQSTSAPAGFSHSLKLDVTSTDTSLAAGDNVRFQQRIEGYNLKPFATGTANAKHHTLSFWVRSNITGTYIAELRYSDGSLEASQSYTIDQSGVWEYKVLVFPPNTTSTVTYDNAQRLDVNWFLAAGSDFSGGTELSTTWTTTDNVRAVGQINAVKSTDNEWYITGVQLVAGNYPEGLPFMHRSYGEELALCQRYFWQVSGNASDQTTFGNGYSEDTDSAQVSLFFPVEMRDAPSTTVGTGVGEASVQIVGSGVAHNASLDAIIDPSRLSVRCRFNADSGTPFTAGHAIVGRLTNSSSAYIWVDAEL